MKNLYLFLLCFLPFSIVTAQSSISVSPGTAFQGQTLQVTISGQNTFFTQTSTTSWLTRGIDAILPSVNTVQSPTMMQSIYAIPANAGVGYWDMHVMDGFGEVLALDAIFIDETIGVDPRAGGVRESLQLGPNPAQRHYNLRYALPGASKVQITLRDLRGNLLRELFSGRQHAGDYDYYVQVSDLNVPAGTYLTCLQVDDMIFAIKTTLLR